MQVFFLHIDYRHWYSLGFSEWRDHAFKIWLSILQVGKWPPLLRPLILNSILISL